MKEIQNGLMKEEHTFIVKGVEHKNSRLHAKEGYHFYSVTEYENDKKYYEEEKARRLANNENISDLVLQKNYSTFAVTPLVDDDKINAEFKSEEIV